MQQLDNVLRGPPPLLLKELALPAARRIVVLAPHPDDFDAIGVTMRFLHSHGHEIHLAVLTSGASGVDDGWSGATTPETKAALREAEQRASCCFFGLPMERLTFMRLWSENDASSDRERLRSYLQSIRPHLVCLPHGNDTNSTHQRTYETFHSIAEQERLNCWALLNRDAKTISMQADLYMYFDDAEAAWKSELLRFHRSQHERNIRSRNIGFDERVLKLNRQSAAQTGSAAPYAEVFELRRFGS